MSAISRTAIKLLESLASATGTLAPFTTGLARLANNPITWTEDTPSGAIIESGFAGYAAVPVTFGGPTTDLQGDTVISPTVVPGFSCTTNASSEQVQSVYVTGPGTLTSASWLAGATLTPFTPQPGQSWTVNPKVALNGDVDSCLC